MVDGGTAYGVNLVQAIQRCREVVDDDSKITVDLLLINGNPGTKPSVYNETGQDTIKNYQRFKQLKSHYQSGNDWADIDGFMQAFPKVNLRYVVHPSESISYSMLNFENSTTWMAQEMGRKDAKNIVGLGPDWISNQLKKWNSDSSLQKLFPRIADYIHHVTHIADK